MNEEGDHFLVFGPVPSRRLGNSLGINNVRSKSCSYSCTYCQLGVTENVSITRRDFFESAAVYESVVERLLGLENDHKKIDFITFVPNGEPTLDSRLGETIGSLSDIGPPIGVITNSSLLWMEDVRWDLEGADLVSMKVDTVNKDTWTRMNRPHGSLDLDKIMDGIRSFADVYKGNLITETMIVPGMNDSFEEIFGIGTFLRDLPLDKAYLSAPIRPPADRAIEPASRKDMVNIKRVLNDVVGNVELLNIPDEPTLCRNYDIEKQIVAITSVHPMKEKQLVSLLDDIGEERSMLDRMVEKGLISRSYYENEVYLKRRKK